MDKAEHHIRSPLSFGSHSGPEEDERNSSAWHALPLLDRMQEEKQHKKVAATNGNLDRLVGRVNCTIATLQVSRRQSR
jgi:hypothetical protein